MNPFEQKSIFLWNVPQVAGGDPQKIADTLKAGGFSSVWVKAADGASPFYSGWLNALTYRPNVTKAFVDTMHANGIAVIGWGFCYGLGDSEGRIAAQQVDALNLDGWVFDVESKFEAHIDCVARAGQMLGTYKKTVVKKVPTGWCSWAFHWRRGTTTPIHKPELSKFGMSLCNYGVPMVYWNRLDANGKPAVMSDIDIMGDLSTSARQWRDITDKPLIPAGRAYTGDGNVVIPSNVAAFGQATYTNGFNGVTWWSLEHALRLPDIWAALVQTPAFKPLPPPPVPDPQPSTPIVHDIKDKATGQLVPLQLTGNVDIAGTTYVWTTDQRPATPPPPVTPPSGIKPAGTLYRVTTRNWGKYNSGLTIPPNGGPMTQAMTRPKPTGKLVFGDNKTSLPKSWEPWIQALNTAKAWEKIIAPDYGPTFGRNSNGYLIWLGIAWPGNETGPLCNLVSVIRIEQNGADTWALVESLPPQNPPSAGYNRGSAPWLIHEVYGSIPNGQGVSVAPTPCFVPILGGYEYAPGKWGWWMPAALLVKA